MQLIRLIRPERKKQLIRPIRGANMIPKIIHRIWFGPNEIPSKFEQYWQAWQRQHPDYKFITWRDENIDDSFITSGKIKQAHGMPGKADIARYEILYKEGGIYLDCDVMPYHCLNWQDSGSDLIVCNETESDDYCSIGMIACAPRHETMKKAVCNILTKEINQTSPNIETGPYYFRSVLQTGKYHKLNTSAFYPYPYNEPFSSIILKNLNSTYGIHVWAASWCNDAQKIQKISELIHNGELAEIKDLAQNVGEQQYANINQYMDLASKARASMILAASQSILSNFLTINSIIEFEFLKCAFYLFNKTKDTVVWQIGAADGIFMDPLRPLIINYDPAVIMLEPNPYLFQRLKKNYANNKNITFINKALGRQPGQVTLNAINPEKTAQKDLPDWTIGLSSLYMDRNALGGLTIDDKMTKQINDCVEKVEVDMIDIPTLLMQTHQQKPDILVIDAEGMDVEILHATLDAEIKPRIICFEIQCLPQTEMEAATKRLNHDYFLIDFGNDRIAYRKDFFMEYCNYLYVNHGIQTIYGQAFKILSGKSS